MDGWMDGCRTLLARALMLSTFALELPLRYFHESVCIRRHDASIAVVFSQRTISAPTGRKIQTKLSSAELATAADGSAGFVGVGVSCVYPAKVLLYRHSGVLFQNVYV